MTGNFWICKILGALRGDEPKGGPEKKNTTEPRQHTKLGVTERQTNRQTNGFYRGASIGAPVKVCQAADATKILPAKVRVQI